MEDEDMVLVSEFCVHHNVQMSFIHSLQEYGMIRTILVEEEVFLPISEMERLEKIVRLHFELDINLEGIETITHLLERMNAMQQEIVRLTNRLKAYEP
jgi:chaperone modulatory protein CbpM